MQPDELIVVDDGSHPVHIAAVRDVCDRYSARLIEVSPSHGANYCRNLAIDALSTTFVTGLDDDDVFLPRRIELLRASYLPQEHSFVTSRVKFVSTSRTVISKFSGTVDPYRLEMENVVGNQIFVLKERLIDLGAFDISLSSFQDYDLWYRLLRSFGPAKVIRPVTMIIDVASASDRVTASPKRQLGHRQFFEKHFWSFRAPARRWHSAWLSLESGAPLFRPLCLFLCSGRTQWFSRAKRVGSHLWSRAFGR